MDDLPDIHVRLSVWRLGLVMAGLALLALAGVWQVMSEDGVTARSGGGVLAVICGVIAILAGRRLLRGDTSS